MPAIGREDLREEGSDLRLLGQRVAELSEEVAFLAQSYRSLFERLRLSRRPEEGEEEEAPTKARTRVERERTRRPLRGRAPSPHTSAEGSSFAEEELIAVRGTLRGLLDRQGELGRRLQGLARHPLLHAGGDEPRRIRVRLTEIGERCHNLQLSSDALVHGTPRAVSGLLEDLCELNSGASEDLLRFGQGLRVRGDGLLAGKKEERRYLQGEAWRRLR